MKREKAPLLRAAPHISKPANVYVSWQVAKIVLFQGQNEDFYLYINTISKPAKHRLLNKRTSKINDFKYNFPCECKGYY